MKTKRILGLLLAGLMMCSALFASGCNKTDNNETSDANTASTRKVVTLNMYIITEEETNLDSAREVQMAINEITLPKYKTKIKINYLKQDEYWDAIEAAELAVEQYNNPDDEKAEDGQDTDTDSDQTQTPDDTAAPTDEGQKAEDGDGSAAVPDQDGSDTTAPPSEDQTEQDSDGDDQEGLSPEELEEELEKEFNESIDEIFEATDIELDHPQLDIFLVNDSSKFFELINDKKIVSLNSYLNLESKELKKYLFPSVLGAATVGGTTYGIPTNGMLGGEYEYFVFDKALLNKYGYSAADLNKFAGLDGFLAAVKAGEPDVVPLSDITTLSGFEFYGEDGSALAVNKRDTASSWPTDIYPAFMDRKDFYQHMQAIESYRANGYLPQGAVNENTRYAVEIVRSPDRLADEWTDEDSGRTYVSTLYKLPRVTNDQLLNSVFVISSLSVDKARSMEIITLFNTNAELANLLQYGIKGTNYFLNTENNTVTMANTDYTMNPNYTGNRYIKYQLEGEQDYVARGIAHNSDTVPSAFLGFNISFQLTDSEGEPDEEAIAQKEMFDKVNALSLDYYNRMLNGEIDVKTAFSEADAAFKSMGFTEEGDLMTSIKANYEKFVSGVSSLYTIPEIIADQIESEPTDGDADGEEGVAPEDGEAPEGEISDTEMQPDPDGGSGEAASPDDTDLPAAGDDAAA